MDILIVVLSSLQLISIYFIWLFIKNYFSKYVDKKAENLATKEDIGEITRRTEEARRSYTHEIERLRSDLEILREEITSVRTRGDDAVIDFFQKCNILLHDYFAFTLLDSLTIRGNVDEYRHSLERLQIDIRLAQINLLAYFHGNEEIVERSRQLTLACNALRSVFYAYFPSVAIAYLEYRNANPEQIKSEALFEKLQKKSCEYDEAIKTPLKNLHSAFGEFYADLAVYFRQKYQSS
jgi:hypothetical protein